jgi:zinc-ribbon domain
VSERKEAGQPQRYCPICGAEVRPGDAFCAACGVNLTSEGGNPRQDNSSSSRQPLLINDVVKEKFQDIVRGFRGSPGSSATNVRSPQNLLRWFKDLPVVLKAAVVVLGALLLLTVLSPLGLVAALLLFGVSIIGLIVRVGQRRSIKGWSIAAATSLALVVVFSYFSTVVLGSLYDGPTSSTDSGSKKNTTKQATANETNTKELREAAFRPPPLGVIDQSYIDDLRVTGDTATVEFVGMVEPGDNFMAAAERVQGKQTCSSMAKVAAKNDIPVDTVEVMNSRGEELATCDVKGRTNTGKNK